MLTASVAFSEALYLTQNERHAGLDGAAVAAMAERQTLAGVGP